MTARAKLWLSSFIFGFALGLVVIYVTWKSAPTGLPEKAYAPRPYRTEPLHEEDIPNNSIKVFKQKAYLLGTTVQLTAHAANKIEIDKSFEAAFDRIHEIELMMSAHRPDSPLSRINVSGKAKGYEVPEELGVVISRSLEFCRLTGGALDITVKPLLDAYRAAESQKRAPREEKIISALAHVGYGKVTVSAGFRNVTLADDGMAIDLGATAKGYAIEEAAKILQDNGIANGIVEAGGDIRFIGTREGKAKWRTGIQDPCGKKDDFIHILELADTAVCTSGNYERDYDLGGKKASHIIEPRTGKPCDYCPSVTVVAPDAFTADALATALSVLGKKGIKIVEEMCDVEALVIIVENGEPVEHVSTGFRKLLKE